MSEILAQIEHIERNIAGEMESSGIKQWFVIACCKENRNMFVFPFCTGSVTTAVALLFEWHPCHVAACLTHELSSTEENSFYVSEVPTLPTH